MGGAISKVFILLCTIYSSAFIVMTTLTILFIIFTIIGSPIPRRARDERDMHTDVYFYKKPLSLENSASADGVSEVVCGGGASASFSTSDVLEDKK